MFRLSGIAALALALLLAAAAASQDQQLASTFRIQADGDGFLLTCGEDGADLVDVLRAFSKQLELPIAYSPDEVQHNKVFLEGSLPVARDDLRLALVALLDRVGFDCWGDDRAGATLLRVQKTMPNTPRVPWSGTFGFTPRVIEVQDLFEGKVDLDPTCTIVFGLSHVQASDLIPTVNAMLHSTRESVRSTAANQLVVTAGPRRMREVVRLLSALDVAPPSAPPPDALAALEARLAALEARLERLEKHPGR